MIIDIHTHIYDEKIYKSYFDKAKSKVSKAFVMHWHKFDLEKFLEFVASKDNLYAVGSIDVDGDIKNQLDIHQKLFQENKIFGIKLYPGYQYFYSSDKKIYPIAELCQKYNKPLIFHSGDVYDSDKTAILKYAHPIHVDELAVKFPKCKIIISHFGFPYFIETANIVSKNENLYTDISGTIDKQDCKKDDRNLFKQYVKDLQRALSYFPDVKEKIMFATDYGEEDPPIDEIDPYIKIVKRVFKSEQENVFHKLAEKMFF